MNHPAIPTDAKIYVIKTFQRKVGNETYIINASSEKILKLNETGSFLWDQLKQPKTTDELTDLLFKQYNVTRTVAKKDCSAFVKQLSALGILKAKT